MIARFLFRSPRILLLLIAVIIASGVSALLVMPRREDPVLSRRVAVVSTVFPGASAGRVESLVAIPFEQQLSDIADIKQVRTNSQTEICNVTIELADEVSDVTPVWTLIRDRVADVQAGLPDGCESSELDVLPLQAFAAIVALKSRSADGPDLVLLRRLARRLKADVLGIPGTAGVDVFGDPGEEYVAEVQPTTLVSMGLSTPAIASQVRAADVSRPAGAFGGADATIPVAIEEAAMPIDRLRETRISAGESGIVELSRIASIEKRLVDRPESIALVDGDLAITLGVLVDEDLQVDRWTRDLERTIDAFGAKHSADAEVDALFLQSRHIDQRMRQLIRNLGLGTAAVMLIVLVMMGWRSMIVVGAALPLSALMVISAMRFLAIPIHQISVTGLIVALGLLIDNAIVIVEDVRKRMASGAGAEKAIVAGVRHLAMPLFGSTLTTALAFVPIATLPGPPGEFVGTIAVSVILAITASFLLAMTVIPALMSVLGGARGGLLDSGLTIKPVEWIYRVSLKLVFRVPLVGVIVGSVLPVLGFLCISTLPEQFFPPSDRGQIQIELERPSRDTASATLQTVREVRELLEQFSEIERQHWFVGSSAPTFYYNVVPRRRGTPFYAQAFVDLSEAGDTADLVRRIQTELDRQVAAARIIVRELEQGPPFDAPIEVRVIGEDLDQLQAIGRDVRGVLASTPNVIHTRSDLDDTIPRYSLEIDQETAKASGLDASQISLQLYGALEGTPAGEIYEGGESLPVRVAVALGQNDRLNQVAALPIHSTSFQPRPDRPGNTTPARPTLRDVCEIRLDSDVGAIVRIDGRRVNEIKGYLHAGVLPAVAEGRFRELLEASDLNLPAGYRLEFGGETEQRTQAVDRLIANSTVLFVLMALTLVAAFRSFRCALIVACVGGMSVGLGPLALAAFGYPFGFMAIVGTMGLVGVAINDSIVVLAAVRDSGDGEKLSRDELVSVVFASTRHILATTLTTIAGFVPLVIAGGDFWPPLAITIAGGVGGATLLALYFVPSLYVLLVGTAKES